MSKPYQDCAILFGDSITQESGVHQHIQSRFSNAYRRSLDVINRGFGGYNTPWARVLFDTIFAKKAEAASVSRVRVVTVWFGANDSVKPGARQHITVEDFEDNLRFFLESFTSPESPYAIAHAKGLSIVLVTPPPLLHSMMEGKPEDNERQPPVTKTYVDVVVKLAAEYKTKETEDGNWRVGLVNMWDATIAAAGGEGEGLRKYLSDGLHLTTEGYGIFWDEYTKLVKNEFKGRGLDWEDPVDCPELVPSWADVDPQNPADLLNHFQLPPFRQQ